MITGGGTLLHTPYSMRAVERAAGWRTGCVDSALREWLFATIASNIVVLVWLLRTAHGGRLGKQVALGPEGGEHFLWSLTDSKTACERKQASSILSFLLLARNPGILPPAFEGNMAWNHTEQGQSYFNIELGGVSRGYGGKCSPCLPGWAILPTAAALLLCCPASCCPPFFLSHRKSRPTRSPAKGAQVKGIHPILSFMLSMDLDAPS